MWPPTRRYHKAETLVLCDELGVCGITPYIPEKQSQFQSGLDGQPKRLSST